jgi:FkbM family methyltransferase
MSPENSALLKKFDAWVAKKARLHVLPEDMGTGALMKIKRIVRYGVPYVAHLFSELFLRLGLISKKDAPAQTFFGKTLTLPGHDANARIIRSYGTLYPEEDALIRFIISELRADSIFYDIGANYGFYTALAQEIITSGEIHVFEPSPRVFPYLSQLESSTPKTVMNKVALADATEERSLYECSDDNASGQSTLIAEVAKREHEGAHQVAKVQTTTLDDYCKTHKVPTIIKLDVEGGETLVLSGARNTLQTHAPIIMVELWSGVEGVAYSKNVLETLSSMGYEPHRLKEDGTIEHSSVSFLNDWLTVRRAEMNFVFKKLSRSDGSL